MRTKEPMLLLLAVLGVLPHLVHAADKVLIVVSGHGTADHARPGYEFDEFAIAYGIFRENGLDIDVASPAGGAVLAARFDSEKPYNARVLADAAAMAKLADTLPAARLVPGDYRAVFVVGGKGAMFDLPAATALQEAIAQVYQRQGVVSAVCHGPAALVDVRLDDGRYLVEGQRVSAFTNEEERFFSDGLQDSYPFLLEDRLGERGAVFEEGLLMLPHVSDSGRLVTGQNPFSTALVAEAVVRKLGKQPVARTPDAEERTMALLSRVVDGDVDWAREALARQPSDYQMQLIGAWGHYAAMAAVERADIQRAATVMELALPYTQHPRLRLALAKAYVRLDQRQAALALLARLVKDQPELEEARELLSTVEG